VNGTKRNREKKILLYRSHKNICAQCRKVHQYVSSRVGVAVLLPIRTGLWRLFLDETQMWSFVSHLCLHVINVLPNRSFIFVRIRQLQITLLSKFTQKIKLIRRGRRRTRSARLRSRRRVTDCSSYGCSVLRLLRRQAFDHRNVFQSHMFSQIGCRSTTYRYFRVAYVTLHLLVFDHRKVHPNCISFSTWLRHCDLKCSNMYVSIVQSKDIIYVRTDSNNNNNYNKHDNVYGAVIMAEPLLEFTRFI